MVCHGEPPGLLNFNEEEIFFLPLGRVGGNGSRRRQRLVGFVVAVHPLAGSSFSVGTWYSIKQMRSNIIRFRLRQKTKTKLTETKIHR